MKNLAFVLSLLLLLMCNDRIFSQTTVKIQYLYDASGNRYFRHEISFKSHESNNDSTKNSIPTDSVITHQNHDYNTDSENNNDSTGLQFNDDFGNFSITIYPNPTEGKLTIKINSANESLPNLNMSLINETGILIKTKILNQLENTIDLTGYANGTYFLKIKSDSSEKVYNIIKVN